MDTTQVPEFKLAKVGKRRERKKSGLFWLNGGGSGGAFAGATGGTGVLIAKAAIIAMIAALGVGAYNVGASMGPKKGAALQKPKAFASKELPSANAAGAAGATAGPAPASGLAMVSGSLDGKTPEERAAEAAAAEAAAKAEADRKAQEEAAAKKQAEEDAKKAAAAAPDPAAVAAAAPAAGNGAAGRGNPFGTKFGQLSSSLGGGHSGLAGGAGLSGGVGRSFGAPMLGKTQGMGAQAAASRTSAKPVVNRGHSGRAFRQLVAANNNSRAGRGASSAETAAQAADAAFENNPGANNAITGGGAGQGGAGTHDSTPGGGGDSGSGGNGGGPAGCAGDCAGGAPTVGKTDASPWKSEIQWAAGLTIAASALLIIAGALSYATWPPAKAIAAVLGGVAAALGAAVAGLGMAIQGMGGPGMIYTAIGGLVAICGACVVANPQAGVQGSTGITGILASWGGIFAGLIGVGTGVAGSVDAANLPDPPSGDSSGSGSGSGSGTKTGAGHDGTFHSSHGGHGGGHKPGNPKTVQYQ